MVNKVLLTVLTTLVIGGCGSGDADPPGTYGNMKADTVTFFCDTSGAWLTSKVQIIIDPNGSLQVGGITGVDEQTGEETFSYDLPIEIDSEKLLSETESEWVYETLPNSITGYLTSNEIFRFAKSDRRLVSYTHDRLSPYPPPLVCAESMTQAE